MAYSNSTVPWSSQVIAYWRNLELLLVCFLSKIYKELAYINLCVEYLH